MPTARHRYQVTETDEVARALQAAEERWPGVSRSRLILRLITENGETLQRQADADSRRRSEALERVAGSFTGLYPADYRQDLREEWDE